MEKGKNTIEIIQCGERHWDVLLSTVNNLSNKNNNVLAKTTQ